MQRIPKDTPLIAQWLQPKTFERFYQLQAGNLYLGSLQFKSSFSSLALAETADGRWSFKRVGLCHQKVTIRKQGEQADIATCQYKFWGDNELRFNDGKTYIWKRLNFWATQWAFINNDGEVVMVVKRGLAEHKFSDIFKTQMTVEIYPAQEPEEYLSVLLPVSLYLFILQQEDAAATAVVAT